MAASSKLDGAFTVTPISTLLVGGASGRAGVSIPLFELGTLAQFSSQQILLSGDSPVGVPFGGMAGVNTLIVKALDGKVRVRVTSADGTAQAVPVDSLLILQSSSVNITAVDFTRVSGAETTVEVFLGQKA